MEKNNLIGISGKIGSGKDTVATIIQYLVSKEIAHFHAYRNAQKAYGVNPKYTGGWEVKRFAGKLKEIVALLTGCNVLDLENQEFKNKELGRNWWTYKHLDTGTPARPKFEYTQRSCSNLTPEELAGLGDRITKPTYRSLLQTIGTESMRNIIGENVWVNALFSAYKGVFRGGGLTEDDLTEDYPSWIIPDTRFPNEADAIKQNGGILIRVNRGEQPTEGHPSETSLDDYEFHHTIENDGTIEELIEKVRKILLQEHILPTS